MKKIKTLVTLFFVIILTIIFHNYTYAVADYDQIDNYVITINPRMEDGSLDITYEITWRVLRVGSYGPIRTLEIGVPNSSFDSITPLSDNIKSAKKYIGERKSDRFFICTNRV